MTSRAAWTALLVSVLIVAPSASVAAQRAASTLTVTGGVAIKFANPTLADYINGYIDGPTITFTVSTTQGGAQPRATTVEVCATNASLGSGKAISDLLWQPTDNSKPYASIITGCGGTVDNDRVVGSQELSRGSSWVGGLRLRLLLNWTDAAPSYGTPIELVLSVQP